MRIEDTGLEIERSRLHARLQIGRLCPRGVFAALSPPVKPSWPPPHHARSGFRVAFPLVGEPYTLSDQVQGRQSIGFPIALAELVSIVTSRARREAKTYAAYSALPSAYIAE